MAERYDMTAARAAYDATPAAETAALFWHAVSARMGRSVWGVSARLSAVEGWAPKLTRRKPCSECGERFTWHAFRDGGRVRVCPECQPPPPKPKPKPKPRPKPKRGRKATLEERARMSEAKRGTKATPAHRKNIAAGVRRWWVVRKRKEAAHPDPALPTSAENPSK